jgi:hypothetical protein
MKGEAQRREQSDSKSRVRAGDFIGTPEIMTGESSPEVPTESRVRNRQGVLALLEVSKSEENGAVR